MLVGKKKKLGEKKNGAKCKIGNWGKTTEKKNWGKNFDFFKNIPNMFKNYKNLFLTVFCMFLMHLPPFP